MAHTVRFPISPSDDIPALTLWGGGGGVRGGTSPDRDDPIHKVEAITTKVQPLGCQLVCQTLATVEC